MSVVAGLFIAAAVGKTLQAAVDIPEIRRQSEAEINALQRQIDEEKLITQKMINQRRADLRADVGDVFLTAAASGIGGGMTVDQLIASKRENALMADKEDRRAMAERIETMQQQQEGVRAAARKSIISTALGAGQSLLEGGVQAKRQIEAEKV